MMKTTLKTTAILGLALAMAGGCKKTQEDKGPDPVPAQKTAETQGGDQAANPHGQFLPGHGGGPLGAVPGAENPHGGMDPHGGMAMGASGPGKTTDKTDDGRAVLGAITVAVPEGWSEKPVKGGMRAGHFTVSGEAGDADLIIYYFGQGGAGGVQANLDRWFGQFERPEGAPEPKVETSEVAGMKVTTAQTEGKYVAAVMPGATEKHNQDGAKLLAAIIEAEAGPYYFKMVGPKSTVDKAAADFEKLIASTKLAQ